MPYSINGSGQNFAEPKVRDGATFVPLAHLVEVLGGYVTWDNSAKTASIEMGATKASVQAGEPDTTINEQTVTLPPRRM